jgi:hypothetical protein
MRIFQGNGHCGTGNDATNIDSAMGYNLREAVACPTSLTLGPWPSWPAPPAPGPASMSPGVAVGWVFDHCNG